MVESDADDTVLASSQESNIVKWSTTFKSSICKPVVNLPVVNVSKTVHMLFSNKKILADNFLVIKGSNVHRVESSKFLGIFLDENLNFNVHCGQTLTKVARTVGIIKKLNYNLCLLQFWGNYILEQFTFFWPMEWKFGGLVIKLI